MGAQGHLETPLPSPLLTIHPSKTTSRGGNRSFIWCCASPPGVRKLFLCWSAHVSHSTTPNGTIGVLADWWPL